MKKQSGLNEYEKRTVERLQWIVDSLCGGSQQELVDRSGINKGSLSQYLKGRNSPSNLNAKKIADAFDINPAWVMGFDVPMRNADDEPDEDVDQFRQRMRDQYGVLFDMYDGASPEDRKKIEDMVKIIVRHDDSTDGA